MYGIPDPHALIRPWKNLQEFSEELFAQLRPVSGPPAQRNDRTLVPRSSSNVNEVPSQPDLILSDFSSFSDDNTYKPQYGSGARTIMARKPPTGYDTSSTLKPQSYADTPTRDYSASTQDAAKTYAVPADEYTPPRDNSLTIHAQASPPAFPDTSAFGPDISSLRSAGKVAGAPYLGPFIANLHAGADLFSPPLTGAGQSYHGAFQSPTLATSGNFYSPPPNYAGAPAPPTNFYAASDVPSSAGAFSSGPVIIPPPTAYPTNVPGAVIPSVPSGGPWTFVAPFTPGYNPVGIVPNLPPVGLNFVPEAPPLLFPPEELPFIPAANLVGGSGDSLIGKVISGSGNEYQVVTYSNGPDNASDNNGDSVTVYILTIDPTDTIPAGTWLFDILTLQDSNGNDKLYAQPPVWLE